MTKQFLPKSRWLVTIIILTTLSIAQMWGAEATAYTLSATNTGSDSNSTGYANEKSTTISEKTWVVIGNSNQVPWRIGGGKNTTGSSTNRYIYSQTAITENITKVVVAHGSKSNITVNSVTLNVYSTAQKAAAGGTADVSSVSVTYVDNGNMTFNRPSGHNWAGRFYRIDYTLTWSSSSSAKYILFSSATFKYESASCTENPSIGAASLNGSFNMTSTTSAIGVASGTCGAGSSCSWADYGFVWSDGTTTTTPTVSNNKVQVGTSGTATSWTGSVTPSGSTSPTSWTTGHTYYVRTYGKNNKASADFVYGSAWSFTPQSVTFKANGGTGDDKVQYVRNSTSTALTANTFTKTGHSFAGWATTSSGSVAYADEANVNIDADITLHAKWSVNSYDVTLKANGGSSADQVVSATYGEAMPTTVKAGTDIVAPTYNGYTFAGYYDTDASTGGTQYYTNALASAHTWDKGNAANLYGRWTANQYVVTLDANGGVDGATTSVTTTYGSAMPTIATANLPTKEGYRFDGFYTGKTDGTKYYNADGTSAKNQARSSANQVLYAHWVAQTTFSVDGDIDASLTIDDGAAMPSADVPTACGDCWAFIGWSTDSEEDGIPTYSSGDTHEFGEPQTLYAVFGKAEYKLIYNLSDIEANEYYVLSNVNGDEEYAMSNTTNNTYYASSVDITSSLQETGDGWFLYNPSPSVIWKFTGTTSSGRLYNEASSYYLDLSDASSTILKASTTDNLKFTKFNSSLFNIASTTQTSYFLYMYSGNKWSVDDEHDGYSSCYIYKRQSAVYTTSPVCDTYTITWKKNGTAYTEGDPTDETTTCAGIETLPTEPANNSLSCANVFMGWSEEDLSGEDNEEPDDLFWKVGDAPKITENKIFNAVFATGTPVANTYELISPSELRNGQIVLIVNRSSNVAVSSTANSDQLTAVSVSPSEETITTGETSIRWTVTKSGNYYVFKSGDNYLRSGGSAKLKCDGTSDKWSISSGTVDGTYLMTSYNQSSYSLQYYSSKFTSYNGTGTAYNVDFYVQSMTYADYVTNCCTAYTISGASKSGTDVIVSGNTGGTLKSNYNNACEDAYVTLSATVNPGYAFGGWTITGATSGDLTSTLLPGDNATSLTPAAFEMPAENITVSATISEKTATAWTWTYKSGDIPDPLVMYVNEYHQLDVTYVPSDLLSSQKNYTVTKESSVAQVTKQIGYYKMRGATGVTSATSSTVTFSLGGLSQEVNVIVKPLPTVTFVDNIHNKTDFANAGSGYTAATGVLSSTISDGVVTHTQPTPTHANLSVPGSGNACELSHLVLIGWIRSDCPAVDAYMSGTGSKPGNSAITGSGNDGSGRAYFVAAGADINVKDYNGLTFYAVWAKVE